MGIILLVVSFFDNVILSNFLASVDKRGSNSLLIGFIVLSGINISSQSFLLYALKKYVFHFKTRLVNFCLFLSLVAVVLFGFFLSIIIHQMVFLKSYEFFYFKFIVFLSYSTSILILLPLIYKLMHWFKHNHNSILLIYSLSLSVFLLSNVFAIVIVNVEFDKSAQKISFYSNPWDTTSLRDLIYAKLYNIASIISFGLTWLGTALLIKHYSRKMGRILFAFLISLPLIYYIGNLDIVIFPLFNDLAFHNPELFSFLILLLSGTKQVGGLFFAIGFLSAAISTRNNVLKSFLTIIAIGFMLLYSSNQISLLQTISYPPFGLNTITILNLSALMIFIGLYASALSISKDKKILLQLHTELERSYGNFLWSIGSDEWLTHIQKTVNKITLSPDYKDPEIPSSLTTDDMIQYAREVAKEIEKEKLK